MSAPSKINIFFSTLNLVLAIAGYQFATTLLLPVSSDIAQNSQVVTIPYRAFALMISLVVIFFNYRRRIALNRDTLLLLFFWLLYIIRIVYDLSFRSDNYFTYASKIGFYSGVFLITFIPMMSALLSYSLINYDKALMMSILFIGISMTLSISASTVLDLSQTNLRLGGNMALNAISYGMTGAVAFILSGFFLRNKTLNPLKKVFLYIVLLLGIYTIGRAASRSPLLGLIIVLIFYLSAIQKSHIKILLVGLSLLTLLIIFQSNLLDLVGDISPVLETRMRASVEQGDYSDRNTLYSKAINQFYKNPIWGDYFVLYPENGRGINSHNLILDAFMGLGFIGGSFLLIILISVFYKTFKWVQNHYKLSWLGLLLLLQIIIGMSSGSFYNDQLLSFLLAICFSIDTKKIILNSTNRTSRNTNRPSYTELQFTNFR